MNLPKAGQLGSGIDGIWTQSTQIKFRDSALNRSALIKRLVLLELSPAFLAKLSAHLIQRSEAEADESHAGYWLRLVHCRSKDLILVKKILSLADLPMLQAFQYLPWEAFLEFWGRVSFWSPHILSNILLNPNQPFPYNRLHRKHKTPF